MERGRERLRLSELTTDLVRRGFFRDEYSCLPRTPRFSRTAGRKLGERAEELRRDLAAWCMSSLRRRAFAPDRILVQVTEKAGLHGEAIDAMAELLRHELDSGNLERVAELEHDPVLGRRSGEHAELSRRAGVIRYLSRMRRLMLRGDLEAAEREMAHAPDAGNAAELVGEVSLLHGRLLLMRGRLSEALRPLKRAIMAFQDAGLGDAAGRAQLEFGLLLLGRERMSDAHDYFLLVQGEKAVARYTLLRAALLSASCLFLQGKYTRVLEATETLSADFAAAGLLSHLLFVSFLEGRSLFELGRYREAADVFTRGMGAARGRDEPAAFRTHHLWAARCEVYLGHTSHARAVFDAYDVDPELLYFRAEASYRDEHYRQALDTLDKAGEIPDPEPAIGGELPSWTTGFASIEDLAVGRERGSSVLRNLIRSFRSYLLALVGRVDQAMAEAHELTRREHLSPIDPYRRYYFYFYSLILSQAGQNRLEDPLTVLGKSVKHLRERTGRIDQYGHKTDYLHRSYWNHRLMESAKAHNLL